MAASESLQRPALLFLGFTLWQSCLVQDCPKRSRRWLPQGDPIPKVLGKYTKYSGEQRNRSRTGRRQKLSSASLPPLRKRRWDPPPAATVLMSICGDWTITPAVVASYTRAVERTPRTPYNQSKNRTQAHRIGEVTPMTC